MAGIDSFPKKGPAPAVIQSDCHTLRVEAERNFSRKKTGYRWDRMPNNGIEEAQFYVAFCSITSLLTALTAYHGARPDIVCAPRDFSRLNTVLT